MNNEEHMTKEEIWNDVMSDFFPNAKTEEELEYELDCWNTEAV